jgi:hypothetical protein
MRERGGGGFEAREPGGERLSGDGRSIFGAHETTSGDAIVSSGGRKFRQQQADLDAGSVHALDQNAFDIGRL